MAALSIGLPCSIPEVFASRGPPQLVQRRVVSRLACESQPSSADGWARQRLTFMDARLQTAGLEKALVEQKLFPPADADELHDPLGDPPPNSYW